MAAIEYSTSDIGFTIKVGPQGWGSAQAVSLFIAAFVLSVAYGFTFHLAPGEPATTRLIALPLWVIGLILPAIALQQARRRVMLSADPNTFSIAISGPLRKTTKTFPPDALTDARIGESGIGINQRTLPQLELFFSNCPAPVCLLAGYPPENLSEIIQHLAPALPESCQPQMSVEYSPIHMKTLRLVAAAAVIAGFIDFSLQSQWGKAACLISFIGIVLGAIILLFSIARKCECPTCRAVLKRDNWASSRLQYTCPTCRIIWKSFRFESPTTP